MIPITVCTFWIHRPEDFPNAPDYGAMLQIVDRSCRAAGFAHVVLTDHRTEPMLEDLNLTAYVVDLPNNLMKASTEAHARWLESGHSRDIDTIFVGADCLVRRDFRAQLPACDLAIAYMKGHKLWRLNNGFVYIPAASREKVAPVLRSIANDTSEEMFDDMLAFERALEPMPPDFGRYERRGLKVAFLPLPIWNRYMAVTKRTPRPLEDAAEDANVLHFMGGHDNGKALFFEWAARHMGD